MESQAEAFSVDFDLSILGKKGLHFGAFHWLSHFGTQWNSTILDSCPAHPTLQKPVMSSQVENENENDVPEQDMEEEVSSICNDSCMQCPDSFAAMEAAPRLLLKHRRPCLP